MLLSPLVMWMSGYSALMRRQHSAKVKSAVWSVDSVTTSGSMCRRLGAMPYRFALSMMPWNTSMRFSTEYEFAPEEVQEACSKYAKAHPRIILEIEYSDHDEEVFQRIRFKGKLREHRDAAYHFMPFEDITLPKEEPPLPVIEFTYGSVETEDAFSLMVILGRVLSPDEMDSLEDSISSYVEENTDYCFEELIRDVLEAAGVEYWIISPMRTYRI